MSILASAIPEVWCQLGCEDTGWLSELKETDQTRRLYGEGQPVWIARRCPCVADNPNIQRKRERAARHHEERY